MESEESEQRQGTHSPFYIAYLVLIRTYSVVCAEDIGAELVGFIQVQLLVYVAERVSDRVGAYVKPVRCLIRRATPCDQVGDFVFALCESISLHCRQFYPTPYRQVHRAF